MSITCVTGTPGSGKTLYTVGNLLRPIIGKEQKATDSKGQEVTITRRILSNINGLVIDHEKIGPDELNTWHEWSKPGDLIVFDEVQNVWDTRTINSKVPDYMQALTTHRHKGVDFIIITQNVMLIDRYIIPLIDRHLHVRRVSNIGAAIVYEWDHCSRVLNYRNTISKHPWRYDKSVFKLYASAQLHTRQRRSIPAMVFFILAGLAAAGYLWPTLYQRFNERAFTQPPPAQKPPTKAAQNAPQQAQTLPPSPIPFPPASASPVATFQAAQVSCISSGSRCTCYNSDGSKAPANPDMCFPDRPPVQLTSNLSTELPKPQREMTAYDLAMFDEISKMKPSRSFD
jgi:zona occludens toxin